jgi:TonB family protein
MQGRREEFGNYLLLKKLAEDPLGESFRAGRRGDRSLDQVVLLRAWNGSGLDTTALWEAIQTRKDVQGALKSPNIGDGLEVDRVGGVPYAAYDYVSGTTLSLLAAQADQQLSPFPTDHALLIAERLSLGLAAAHETRHGGQRVYHGFVVPDLVMISNEGETRVLGFEAGPGLAAQANRFPAEIQRYISPEVRTGNAPAADDDVFSLGAILYELLTGEALPAMPPEGGYGALLQRAQLASEGVPLPAEMSTLLTRSLGPKGERIGDVSDWHKEISRLMAAGDYNPTTFNLAFFMHNLFRDEIERESREIEAEKTMELPVAGTSLAHGSATETLAVPAQEMRAAAAAGESGSMATYDELPESKSRAPLFLAIAAVLVLLLGAGWWFMNQSAQRAEQQAQANAVPAEPVPQGPTPEEIQAQIDAMLDERADQMEANLQEQYDERLAALQGQLTDAQNAAAERRRLQEEQRREQQEAEAEAERLRQQREADDEAERLRQQREAEAEAERLRQQRAAAAAAEPEQEEQTAATPPPEPAAPAVRRGELVNDGPGVNRPSVRNKVTPTYPPAARRLGRKATVDVRVLVDENGRVIDAEIEGRDPGVGFGDAALDAARRSTFSPATKEGVEVRMWTTLRFTFG